MVGLRAGRGCKGRALGVNSQKGRCRSGGFLSSEPEELTLAFRAPLVAWPPISLCSPPPAPLPCVPPALDRPHREREQDTDTRQLMIPHNFP